MRTAQPLDPALPTLVAALDSTVVEQLLAERLGCRVRIFAGHLVRHKPGRRCLVEYEAELEGEAVSLLGKIRAGRPNRSGFHLLQAFRQAGFADDAPDGITVPAPVAVLPELQMWLQRKVDATPATSTLDPRVARRVAEAAHKIHRAGVPARRTHTIRDELNILRTCLAAVAEARPAWSARLARIADGCGELGRIVDRAPVCGIHRDFYADQVLVAGDRLTVVDFDLYCEGDAALDAGNFIGHIIEQSVREHGDPDALGDAGRALEQRFVELAGPGTRTRVDIYATLTLARHVYLSTKHREQNAVLTQTLLELVEQRLGVSP
jgi:hypothetical protein